MYSIEVDGVVNEVDCGENEPEEPGDFERAFVRKDDSLVNCEWVRLLALA